ncbi:hypothetical protein B0H12DRAFT_1239891 [Mycena haematopus]|nr:hypothetical protein B0H12DRAFT_1239891 [Mycena haematopus]
MIKAGLGAHLGLGNKVYLPILTKSTKESALVFSTVGAFLPHSTNAAESGHWLLYRAVGTGFDLFEGIRRLYRFQRETEMLYAAITVGHVDARFQGTKPQQKSRLKWHENDGRAPDTRERLAAVLKLEAEFEARNKSLTDEERWIACNSAPALPTAPPALNSTPPTAYFRAFIAMGSAVRGDFLRRIRTETPNTGLRDVIEHFWLRGLLCGAISAPTSTSAKGITKPSHKKLVDALLAGQLNVKRLLKTKWDGGDYVDGMPGCSRTWVNQMVNVSSGA